MGQLSKERLRLFDENSWKYYDWLSVLQDNGVKEIQDLQGQYLLKCPFHEDWNPSFRIRLHEHNYHCFSCGAFGTVTQLMWKLSESTLSQAQFYEQLLKANPAFQKELGFTSLYIDARTLDPQLAGRRRFNPKSSLGMQLPIAELGRKVRGLNDSWAGLVYSLTMLQAGETTDNVWTQAQRVLGEEKERAKLKSRVGSVSLLSLLDDEALEDGDIQ